MTFVALQKLVLRATQPDAAALYRKLYGLSGTMPPVHIESWDDWKSLPLLTKKNLLETPIAERTFIPRHAVVALEATSGTSGNPPVFIPWTFGQHGYGYRRDHFEFNHATMSSSTACLEQEWILEHNSNQSALMLLDPKYPSVSVQLAAALGIDSLFAYVFHLQMIGEEMERQGIAKNIKFIEYYGESATRASLEYLRDKFPNAVISGEYASMDVEANPIGVVCIPRDESWAFETFHGCVW